MSIISISVKCTSLQITFWRIKFSVVNHSQQPIKVTETNFNFEDEHYSAQVKLSIYTALNIFTLPDLNLNERKKIKRHAYSANHQTGDL